MKKLVPAVLVVLLLLVGGAIYGSPYRAVDAMTRAAQAGDAAKLAEYVDFPALRANLKAALSAKLAPEPKGRGMNLLAAFGASLAGTFVDKMVDAMVTPEGLAAIMKGKKPGSRDAGSASEVSTELSYNGFSEFVVTIQPADGAPAPLTLVMERSGLFGWRLSRIRLH